jgi:phosphoribosyl-ATP pyrophosphohydrolase/phosphoribosyl-AMP cyclohydrolase
MKISIEEIKFDERGLIPAIVQDAGTRRVLTLAYMNADSLKRTIETGETWFWSRSRSCLWHKGETSGNTQHLVDILLDCDADSVTLLVQPNGPACHTGEQSCFHNELQEASDSHEKMADQVSSLGAVLEDLYLLVKSRKRDRPEGSYTTYLFDQGLDKILKKVGEESSETIIAAKNQDPADLTREAADLLYHLIVLMVERGVALNEIRDELVSRSKKS